MRKDCRRGATTRKAVAACNQTSRDFLHIILWDLQLQFQQAGNALAVCSLFGDQRQATQDNKREYFTRCHRSGSGVEFVTAQKWNAWVW